MMELILHRMRREMRSRWLRTACLNVVIAAICYNPALSIILLQRPLADTGTTLLSELIRQWLANATHLVGYLTWLVCSSHPKQTTFSVSLPWPAYCSVVAQ